MSPGLGHTHFSPANESDLLTATLYSAGQIESGSKSEPLQRSDSKRPLVMHQDRKVKSGFCVLANPALLLSRSFH